MSLFQGLIDTFPHFKEKNIQEIWFGYRPGTTDLDPILGEYWIKNLYIATGHYRNGILLAPITEKLIVELIDEGKQNEYLEAFSWKRFV
jgi:glycine/D-amino acid oxidase-like deaminating enzyme